MKISATMICDSIGTNNKRLTTLQLQFHRFILPEFNTHRMFSRNASSSRAIPTSKLIEQVRNDPVMPIFWGKNQAGMQAKEELKGFYKETATQNWKQAAINAANSAEAMLANGLHKQTANRVLEPFLPINVIVTATEWDNFFELRDHKDAQPEMEELAKCTKQAMWESTPTLLSAGQWHLPYITKEERVKFHNDQVFLAKLSAARCARVSFLNHDGTSPIIEKDLQLFSSLIESKPVHASPTEHQAYFDPLIESSRNFKGGWVQFRDYIKV